MNITENIQFDNNLIGNETVTLKYDGYLFQNKSDDIFVIYGYDDDWKNTTKKRMARIDDGFVCQINVYNYSSLNFCFKNSEGIWDNNFGKNFSAPIKMRAKSNKFIINENVLPSLISELIETGVPDTIKENTVAKTESNNKVNVVAAEIANDYAEDITEEEKNYILSVVENYDDIHNNNDNIANKLFDLSMDAVQCTSRSAINNIEILVDALKISARNYQEYEKTELANIESEDQNVNVAETQESRDFDMDELVDSILSPIANSVDIDKESIKNFDIDDLVKKYTPDTSSFDANTIQFNKITVDDVINAQEETIAQNQETANSDLIKKQELLDEVEVLYAAISEDLEDSNADALYKMTTGTDRNEDIQEVDTLITETEETIKNIQSLFDEIHSINAESADNKPPIETIEKNESADLISEPETVEETSLFNEFEDDKNEFSAYSFEEKNDDNKKETTNNEVVETVKPVETENTTSTETDEGKFLIVSNKSLSTTKKVQNRFKLALLKIKKLVGSALEKLFN